jgi:hypothetical protein
MKPHMSDDAVMMAALLTFYGLFWLIAGLAFGRLLWGVP